MDKSNQMFNNSDSSTPQQLQDRRSLRTQQALVDALITLMSNKHYDTITIKDIVEQANIGRSTFYAHYQTKDDLLMSGLGRMLDALLQQVSLNEEEQNLKLNTTMLFHHARGHFEIYRTLMWGTGSDILIQDGHAALSAKLESRLTQLISEKQRGVIPVDILAYSMAGSLLILLKWWLDHKMPYSPERMDEIFQQLVMPGVRNTLALNKYE
jgi:AcrR family transcriptional regulator